MSQKCDPYQNSILKSKEPKKGRQYVKETLSFFEKLFVASQKNFAKNALICIKIFNVRSYYFPVLRLS